MRCGVLAIESHELCVRVIERGIWLEPPEDMQVGAQRTRLYRHQRPLDRPGDPDIGIGVCKGKGEEWWKDADDGVRRSRKRDSAPEDGAIASEVLLPQAGADHCDVRAAGAVFRGEKRAAECWRDVEDAEEVGGDARGTDHFRLALSGEGHLFCPAGKDAGLGVGAGGGAELVHMDGGGAAGQDNQFLRVSITQGAQQHGAQDGEERSVGADTERHREHDSGRKARTPGEHSGGEAKVLPQCAEKARFTHRRLFPASKAIFTSLYL